MLRLKWIVPKRLTQIEVNGTHRFASKHSVQDLDCSWDYQETGTTKEQNEGKSFHMLAFQILSPKSLIRQPLLHQPAHPLTGEVKHVWHSISDPRPPKPMDQFSEGVGFIKRTCVVFQTKGYIKVHVVVVRGRWGCSLPIRLSVVSLSGSSARWRQSDSNSSST